VNYCRYCTYAELKQTLKYKNYAQLLTSLKKEINYNWLTEVNSQSLQQSLKDLEKAFVSFFSKQTQFPKFKKKTNRQSFRVPQHFSITEDGKLKLPKLKPIKMVIHREIIGKLCNVTISKTPTGKYYASIIVEYEAESLPLQGDKIGIDVAWGQFLTLLGYKSENLGCEIKKVDRFFPSSKRCHVCGWLKTDLTLKDRQWKCEECLTFHASRDRNAALNILLFADHKIPQEVRKSTLKEIPETVCISRVTD